MDRAPLIIAVVGGTGSGKTTVARALLGSLGLDAILHDRDAYCHDLSHLALDERRAVNLDHPDSIDTEADLRLDRACARRAPATHRAAGHRRGNPALRRCTAPPALRHPHLRGRGRRRPASAGCSATSPRGDAASTGVIAPYLATVRPMHLECVEPSKRYADVIVPEGGHNRIGIEMLQACAQLEMSRRRGEAAQV